MSRQLGYFDDSAVRDYPELNKCPDCETFFESDCCPLCGRVCPEEMRAGKRAAVKYRPQRHARGNGRVTFVPWYLSTWFIVLMFFVQPIVGLILLWMSDFGRGWKIALTVIVLLLSLGGLLLGGLSFLFEELFYHESLPDGLELSMAEYAARCETVDPEALYRNATDYNGDFISVELTVDGIWTNENDYQSDYARYYYCYAENENGGRWYFLVRDYRQGETFNLAVGDRIVIYGQGSGNVVLVNRTAGEIEAPGISMAYLRLIEE